MYKHTNQRKTDRMNEWIKEWMMNDSKYIDLAKAKSEALVRTLKEPFWR